MLVCDPSCLTCTGRSSDTCLSCHEGTFLQPHTNTCLYTCPRGYAAEAGVCVWKKTVLDLSFSGPLNATSQWRVKVGQEASAPLPQKDRGAYFNGSAALALETSSQAFSDAKKLTIEMWIRPLGSGTIFAVNEQTYTVLSLRLNSDLGLVLHLNGTEIDTGITCGRKWMMATLVLIKGEEPMTVRMVSYMNGVQASYVVIPIKFPDLSDTAVYAIGRTRFSDYYAGFIWRLTLFKYAQSSTTVKESLFKAGCPSADFCLSEAEITQTPDFQQCKGECAEGCVRSTDCRLCADPMCEVCADFSTPTCTQCVSSAILHGTQCRCPRGRFYDAGDCLQCSPQCATCDNLERCTQCANETTLTVTGKCKVCGNCDQPLQARIESMSERIVVVKFNREITSNLTEDNFLVTVDHPKTLRWVIKDSSPTSVSLYFTRDVLSCRDKITIQVLSPLSITDEFGFSLSTPELIGSFQCSFKWNWWIPVTVFAGLLVVAALAVAYRILRRPLNNNSEIELVRNR